MCDRVAVSFTTRPELSGTFGMVASTHWLASASGMAVLEAGGNAFDAAVAAGFVLQVVEPHLNGPGGDMPAIVWSAERGEPLVLCAQGPAPARATIEHYRSLGLERVPGTGLLAACVPGAFDGWLLMLRDLGTKRLAEVMAPALHYAAGGFPVLPKIHGAIAASAELFRAQWPSSAELWLRDGRPPAAGGYLANTALAGTYGRLVADAEQASGDRDEQIEAARRIWREGFVADTIVAFVDAAEVADASGARDRGVLSGDDLAGWRATWEAPLQADFGRFTVCKTAPWGQGPVFLQLLRLLEGFDLEALGRDSAAFAHTVVECMKLALADREAWYGDVEVPVADLLSASYAAERRALVGEEASRDLRPGAPGGRAPRLPRLLAEAAGARSDAVGIGEPTLGDTCHVDVADRWGNLVSATPSGGWLQSSPAIPGLGFSLGTRAQMFWLEEGLPASLAPGRRPRTTLSPSLALRDGDGALAFGTPGGDQQDQWSPLFLLSHAVFGLHLQAAIDAPAFHTAHMPSSFYPRAARPGHLAIEERAGEAAIGELRDRGHDVEVAGPWALGRLSAVARDRDGILRAAANPRGMQGYAVGR
jgi:gamma-glutamyltranspeptidase/glutathione hydrolase